MAKNYPDRKADRASVSADLPLVSVVIPCLNRAHLLVPTIESVLTQDYSRIECVIIDGGSTDGTLEIVRRYGGRIRWISETDSGPPDAINKGWRMSSGEILAWLNADDVWAPGAVSKAVSYFQEHAEADVVYGDCGIIDQDGSHIATARVRDWDLEYAVKYCDFIIYQAASFMRRGILERVGWLYPHLCHDHELWLRISLAGGTMRHIPAVLAYARDHRDNLGYRSDIVIPLKLGLTKKFFESPGLPPELYTLRDRAVSNAYLRGMDHVFKDQLSWDQYWLKNFALLWRAFWADPSNVLRAWRRFFEAILVIVFRTIRPYLPNSFLRGLLVLKQRLFRNPYYEKLMLKKV